MVNDIKNILSDKDMPIDELAKKVGVSYMYISKVINNLADPSLKVAVKICRVLDKDFEDVFSMYDVD